MLWEQFAKQTPRFNKIVSKQVIHSTDISFIQKSYVVVLSNGYSCFSWVFHGIISGLSTMF